MSDHDEDDHHGLNPGGHGPEDQDQGNPLGANRRRSGQDRRETPAPPAPALPHWVKEMIAIVTLIVGLTVGWQDLKSEIRSNRERDQDFRENTREQLEKISGDQNEIRAELKQMRASIPNRELYDARFREMEKADEELRTLIEIERMMTQKTREGLIRKGIID